MWLAINLKKKYEVLQDNAGNMIAILCLLI